MTDLLRRAHAMYRELTGLPASLTTSFDDATRALGPGCDEVIVDLGALPPEADDPAPRLQLVLRAWDEDGARLRFHAPRLEALLELVPAARIESEHLCSAPTAALREAFEAREGQALLPPGGFYSE